MGAKTETVGERAGSSSPANLSSELVMITHTHVVSEGDVRGSREVKETDLGAN